MDDQDTKALFIDGTQVQVKQGSISANFGVIHAPHPDGVGVAARWHRHRADGGVEVIDPP